MYDQLLIRIRIGQLGDNVSDRIKSGWLKWRSVSKVLCGRCIRVKLKRKFYGTTIRPTLVYFMELNVGQLRNNMLTR